MPSEAFNLVVRPFEVVRRIIWFALTGYAMVLVGFLYLLFGLPTDNSQALSHPFTVPLAVLALIAAAMARGIPNYLLSDEKVRDILSRDPDPATLVLPNPRASAAERLEKIKLLPKDEQRLLAVAQAFTTPYIVRLALHESIALYGFILAYLSHTVLPAVPFAAATVVLNLTVSPSLESSLERVQLLRAAA